MDLKGRRLWLKSGLAALAAGFASGCQKLADSERANAVVGSAEGVNYRLQRLLQGRRALAPEFKPEDIAADFRGNGETEPWNPDYKRLAEGGFKDWRLVIDGLVEHPMSLSLDEVRALPARTQITRHDCVEGWTCIGQWTGARLGPLLDRVKLKPNARYIVFHCADDWERTATATKKYYESIDLVDAYHPQTILAYALNGETLPIKNGAPLRLRVERQLGYKHAKYLMRIEVVESFSHIGRGKGGYWPDNGYEWFAGV